MTYLSLKVPLKKTYKDMNELLVLIMRQATLQKPKRNMCALLLAYSIIVILRRQQQPYAPILKPLSVLEILCAFTNRTILRVQFARITEEQIGKSTL